MRGIWLVLVMPGWLWAQEQPKGVIEGMVVNSMSGEPVRRATVVLTRERASAQSPSLVYETAGDGVYRFEGLEADRYTIVAHRAGFLDSATTARRSQLPLAQGQRRTGLTLKLSPPGVIAGTVFDEEGEPVQGALVQVMRRWDGTRLSSALRGPSATDDRGAFRITNLVAGNYVVVAKISEQAVVMKRGAAGRRWMYVPTYFPNTPEAEAAQGITVRNGEETAGIDVRLRTLPAFRLVIRVEGSDLDGVSVRVFRRAYPGFREPAAFAGRAGIEGLFEISGLPAGSWYVHAFGISKAGKQSSGGTPIEISNGDLNDVVVRLDSGRSFTGSFAYEGPDRAKPKWQDLHIGLSSDEGSTHGPATVVDERGAFTVRYDWPARSTIVPEGPLPPGVYLASVRVGADECYGKELDLSRGPLDPVTVLFRYGTGVVEGKVEGPIGESVEERGMAVLLPEESNLQRETFLRTASVDSDGAFAFRDVRPGAYVMFHMLGDDPLSGVPPRAIGVNVKPHGKHSVILTPALPQ